MTDRVALRTQLRLQRQHLSVDARQHASHLLCHYILTTPWFTSSRHIAFYLAVDGELDPAPLMEQAWKQHKICYLPVCRTECDPPLAFLPYHPGDPLRPNRYRILEPIGMTHAARSAADLDVVFTPLLAFDAHGNRLGSGKGYYDRTFAFLAGNTPPPRPQLVGLAYDFQQIPQLDAASWDVPLRRVLVVTADQIETLEW